MKIFNKLISVCKINLKNYLYIFDLKHYIKPFIVSIIGLVLLNICVAIIGMLNPLITQVLIDKVLPNRDLNLFYILFAIYIGIFATSLVIQILISKINTTITQKMLFKIKRNMQKACSKASYRFFASRSPGEHIYRFNSDAETVVNIFTSKIPEIFMSIVQLILFLVISFWYNKKMTFLYLAIIPFKIAMEFFVSNRTRPLQVQQLEIGQEINNFYSENILGILTIKLFSREKFEENRLVKILVRQIRLVFKSWRISTAYGIISSFFGGIWEAFVMFFGWYLVIKGELTIGALVALQLYLGRLAGPIGNTIKMISVLMQGSIATKRIQETLNAEQEENGNKSNLDNYLHGDIEFSKVDFGYSEEKPVVKDISFVIKPGMAVGITGPSGVGKTTLINLLLQVYKQNSGLITIGGVDIQTLTMKDLRKHFSIVQQEVFFFQGTIRDNILFGNKYADEDQIIKAARAANAHDFIINQKDGYNTILGGKEGINLSTGQKQRLALARALIKDSPILIMDEFTASLDAESEYSVLNNLKSLFANKVILIISHKVSQLMETDFVLVIYNGKIAQSGLPNELVKQEGVFKKLHNLQFRITELQFENEYRELERDLVKR